MKEVPSLAPAGIEPTGQGISAGRGTISDELMGAAPSRQPNRHGGPLVVVVAIISLAACTDDGSAQLEARIANVEARVQRAESQVRSVESRLGVERLRAMAAEQRLRATPSTPRPPSFGPLTLLGRVHAVSGAGSVQTNAPCSVTVTAESAGEDLSCRIIVRCDNRVIYGAPGVGYNACVVVDGQPRAARDTTGTDPTGAGDPMLDMDLPRRRIVVSNETPQYSIEIALDR